MHRGEEKRSDKESEYLIPLRMNMIKLESRYWGMNKDLGSIVMKPICMRLSKNWSSLIFITLISPASVLNTLLEFCNKNNLLFDDPDEVPSAFSSNSIVMAPPWQRTTRRKSKRVVVVIIMFSITVFVDGIQYNLDLDFERCGWMRGHKGVVYEGNGKRIWSDTCRPCRTPGGLLAL